MPQALMRIEGVNLAAFVDDTNDLSTIRGGSLVLLEAVERVRDAFRADMTPLVVGASKGLFLAKAADDAALRALAGRVRALLCGNLAAAGLPPDRADDAALRTLWPILSNATFVVDMIRLPPPVASPLPPAQKPHGPKAKGAARPAPAGAESAEDAAAFRRAGEAVLALNRWQQMQAPSRAVPSGTAERVCTLDGVRPAVGFRDLPGYDDGLQPVSDAVWQRREFGQSEKRGEFYRKRTGLADLHFVNDLKQLSTPDTAPLRHQIGNLAGKIAVLHIDGDKFGRLERQVTEGSVTLDGKPLTSARLRQSAFDEGMRTRRNKFLKDFLLAIRSRKEWLNSQRIRLETLLWGGDEMTLVVPAWLGWATLGFFYRHTAANWPRAVTPLTPGPNAGGAQAAMPTPPRMLTHSAGLVFCHHTAPIRRMTELAGALCGMAKSTAPEGNHVVYQVLESFDVLGQDAEVFRLRRMRAAGLDDPRLLCVNGTAMEKALRPMDVLRKCMPRRRLLGLVTAMHGDTNAVIAAMDADLIKEVGPDGEKALAQLAAAFGAGRERWIHLVELWDYLMMGPISA